MMAKSALRIVFVCTGNICRSPMAEGLLQTKLLAAGLAKDALLDSAGMHAEVGRSPEPLAIELANESGADISGLLSRPFEAGDFERFDHFIAMDLGHLDYLQAICPQGRSLDIRLLLDDVGDLKKLEVPDPYLRNRGDYEFSARLINIGIDHLIKRLF